jgi:anthranilate synthase component 1
VRPSRRKDIESNRMKLREIFRKELPLKSPEHGLAFLCELAQPHLKEGAFLFRKSERVQGSFLPIETSLAFKPFETIRVRQGEAQISAGGESVRKKSDPFSILNERLAAYEFEFEPSNAFQPSIMGYVSFESVRYLERVLLSASGSFSDSGSEDSFDAEFMMFRCFFVIDHVSCLIRAIVLGHQAEPRLCAEMDSLLEQVKTFRPKKEETLSVSHELQPELHTTQMKSLQGREGFLKKVNILKNHIVEGDIFQAVLSEKFETPFSSNPIDLFQVLAQASPAPYQFCFLSDGRAFLGASPEMLLKVQDGILETHPIAGTRPRGRSPEEEQAMAQELIESEKERAEHLMLVDLARNDIGKVADVGSVFVESFQQIEKFGGVMHLVSKVKGKLKKGSSASQAFASCFPAGTLSGAPKIRALQLLSELEGKRRGFYGGAVVIAKFNGDFDSCISIRSIEISGGVAKVQAGAGIVADSMPESEYEEVQHKTRATRRALATLCSGRAL